MRLSAREVCQLADRCFSAAGFSAGMATDAAEAIWWTEAYKGTGLTTLHRLVADLDGLEAEGLRLAEQSSMAAVVDSDRRPSLFTGTPVVDLCCSMADQHGSGLAYTAIDEDDETTQTLGYLAHRAAERGFVSLVSYTDGGAGSGAVVGLPAASRPEIVEVDLDAPSVGHRKIERLVAAGIQRKEDAPLTQLFFGGDGDDEYETAEATLVARTIQQSTEPIRELGAEVTPSYAVICVDPQHPRQPDELRQVGSESLDRRPTAITEEYPPDEMAERIETLVRDGVEVDRDVWRDIFDYSSGILAPPFEGSRQDAGFGLNG